MSQAPPGGSSHQDLAARSRALKTEGRLEEALRLDREATERFAGSAVAWHNLAATLGDLGQAEASKAAAERAFALGLDGTETWRVQARALLALGEHDAAEAAFAQAQHRALTDAGLAAERAEVIWMRRGDLDAAQALLDQAFHAGAPPAPLLLAKAGLYKAAGDLARAADLLAAGVERLPRDVPLLLAAAQAGLEAGRLAIADGFAQRAAVVDPGAIAVINQLCILDLATGRADQALRRALAGLERAPDDQSLLGWAATAARALGDPLYRELCDYDAMVGVHDFPTPEGWPSLTAYLADLAKALRAMHLYRRHPSALSVREGSQTQHRLTGSPDPAIRAFFETLKIPMAAYLKRLGAGDDPLRSRNTGRYRLTGAWSVLLRPGGFHTDHFHPEGWISSAFYVETPEAAVAGEGHAGWLRFGVPPFRTDPSLTAEHYVRPRPGRLVLFPSYMWHGTVPFRTDEARLSLAFDAVPA